MAEIQFVKVTKAFGSNKVIEDLDLTIQDGKFTVLVGASGCGKTTLLRMIIGFNSIEAGEIRVDGKVVNRIPTNKRNMGMVFQNYAVFPHMSVRDNVAYGLKNRHVPKEERYRRVDEILKLVKIDSYADRMPAQLSGGQQQRVAIARALALQPDILCFDEPTSALDPELTGEVLKVIRSLSEQHMTMIIVTHEMAFARDVAGRVIFMDGGVIVEQGPARDVIENPQAERTRQFLARYRENQ